MRQPIQRPLELVTRDGGGVYFDEYLARSKRWRLDRLLPGARRRLVRADGLPSSFEDQSCRLYSLISLARYTLESFFPLQYTLHSEQ